MTTTITVTTHAKPALVRQISSKDGSVLSEVPMEPNGEIRFCAYDGADLLVHEVQGQEGDAPLTDIKPTAA